MLSLELLEKMETWNRKFPGYNPQMGRNHTYTMIWNDNLETLYILGMKRSPAVKPSKGKCLWTLANKHGKDTLPALIARKLPGF